MAREGRIVSVVEDSWGTSVIYDTSPSQSVLKDAGSQELIKNKDPSQRKLTPLESFLETGSLGSAISDKDFDINEYWCVPYFQSSLFATILEDAITQVRILTECNNEMRIIKTMADMKLLLALKYGVEQPPVLDELDGIDAKKLDCIEYSLNKLNTDRLFVGDVLVLTYTEMSISKCFKPLLDHVRRIIEHNKHLAFLIEDEAKNKTIRRELNKQLRQQRNHIKTVVYDTEVIVDELRTQVEDASLMAETRSRYVNNWQSARTEQHVLVIHNKESISTDSIEFYKQRTDQEQRETLHKVEEWMDKYEKDMEQIDLKIQIKKNDYQNMLEKRIHLEQTIEKHDVQMKAWNHFKDEREKARQYQNKMNTSAIIVQAWWRGLLVRRELGPYKIVKKRGGGRKK